MALSNKDLADIAKEFAVTKSDQGDDKAAIPSIEAEVKKKEDQAARSFIPYNVFQGKVAIYEAEKHWLGTTHSPITQSQITTFSAADGRNAYFFPTSWSKSNAQLLPNGNGNPTAANPNGETTLLNSSVEDGGIIARINLLRYGQSSGQPSHTLAANYSPGASSITVGLGETQTVGKYLYIAGSGTSALVLVTAASGSNITITEIIPPAGTISTLSSTVVENIPGFSNAERNTLTSSSYQRILTNLTNSIISSAALWNTALTNQITQLNLNTDSPPSQISAAITSANNAKSAYNTWAALSNTGASGKFVDTSLNNLATGYNARVSFIPTRVSQIATSLGSVAQNSSGNYSGQGLYFLRFKCLNYLINTSNGALFQANALKGAKGIAQQKVSNAADKLATYSTLVRYGAFTKDSTNTAIITIDGVSQFSVGNSVLVTGNDLPAIVATITNISGSNVTLNQTVPKEYTKAAKAAIIKAV